MRVLIAIDSLAVGGAERSLVSTARQLVAMGLDMHVAYLVPRLDLEHDLVESGVVVHAAAGSGGRRGNIVRLSKLIRELQPDLVHTTLFEADFAGRIAARLAGIPVVSSFVSEAYGPEHVDNPEYKAWKVRGAQLADLSTARLATRFHAVSQSTGELMRTRLMLPNRDIVVVPRGRDAERLGVRSPERARLARESAGVSHDRPIVLAASRHYHMKGLDILVRAFSIVNRALPDALLLIAGRDGPSTPVLQQLIVEGNLGHSVKLMGYRSDVPELMTAADVFVLPSRAEGSPGALIEAMALEAPSVASDILSVREIAGVRPPAAALTELESVDEMAGAIIDLILDPERARTLAALGRERFLARFTIEAVAKGMKSFYEGSID